MYPSHASLVLHGVSDPALHARRLRWLDSPCWESNFRDAKDVVVKDVLVTDVKKRQVRGFDNLCFQLFISARTVTLATLNGIKRFCASQRETKERTVAHCHPFILSVAIAITVQCVASRTVLQPMQPYECHFLF